MKKCATESNEPDLSRQRGGGEAVPVVAAGEFALILWTMQNILPYSSSSRVARLSFTLYAYLSSFHLPFNLTGEIEKNSRVLQQAAGITHTHTERERGTLSNAQKERHTLTHRAKLARQLIEAEISPACEIQLTNCQKKSWNRKQHGRVCPVQ